MNKLSFILIFIGIVLFNANAQDPVKRYKVKSGIVKYTTIVSGKVMGSTINGKGTESLSFKDWGIVELKEVESTEKTVTKIFGQKSEESKSIHTINKLDNGKSYSVDFEKKAIYVNTDMAMGMLAAYNPEGDASDFGKSMLESMGGKKIGEEKILGYNCEVWSVAGGKQWIYNGVVLKVEMTLMGITTTTVAESAKFNISVPDVNFKLPDFPIKKGPSMGNAESMFGDMGDMEMEEMEDFDAEMEKVSKMSYEEWKKAVLGNDDEAAQMSEKELRTSYDMMQKMIKLRNNK